MHIAIGYRWFPTAAGYHLERALVALGHRVTYVGLPCSERAGYDSSVPVDDLLSVLPDPPDMYFWIDPAGHYFPKGIENLSIPTVCYLIDVHLGHWRKTVARFFDGVFIAQKNYLEDFQQAVGHEQVYWLPLAAAPEMHRKLDLPKIYEVGFVGNISFAHRQTDRARRLKMIAERWRTNDFYQSYTPQQVGEVYSQSRIVFNTSIAGDVTMRIFEGTACGAMVITDSVTNGLEELFETGREIVVFHDDDDLRNKIAYYLEHDDELIRIAQAGYDRTHAQHTYLHRMEYMVNMVESASFQRLAPMRQVSDAERWAARHKIYTHLHMLDAILDASRDMQHNLISRMWYALPCLVRRLIF